MPEPGSPDLPEIDIDPFDEAVLTEPYPTLTALRDCGPLFWLNACGVYGMARHAEVSSALRDWETFSSGRGVGLQDFAVDLPWRPASLLLEADPPAHRHARNIMNEIVSLTSLKALRPLWREHADQIASALVARRRFDAVTDLAEAYPLRVFPDTIGLPTEGREHLLPYAAAVFNAYGPRNAVFESTHAALPAASRWVAQACKRANLAPAGWGAKVFRAVDDGRCTEDGGSASSDPSSAPGWIRRSTEPAT